METAWSRLASLAALSSNSGFPSFALGSVVVLPEGARDDRSPLRLPLSKRIHVCVTYMGSVQKVIE